MQQVTKTIAELTGDGAADFAFSGANACAVPDHAILGTVVCLSDSVRPQVNFVVASLFSCREHKKTIKLKLHTHIHQTRRSHTQLQRARTAMERTKAQIPS